MKATWSASTLPSLIHRSGRKTSGSTHTSGSMWLLYNCRMTMALAGMSYPPKVTGVRELWGSARGAGERKNNTGYSLFVGWYICRRLDPFFYLRRTEHQLFGALFVIHQHQNDFWVPIFTELDLIGPKFHFCLDLLWSNFQRPVTTQPIVFPTELSPPPRKFTENRR